MKQFTRFHNLSQPFSHLYITLTHFILFFLVFRVLLICVFLFFFSRNDRFNNGLLTNSFFSDCVSSRICEIEGFAIKFSEIMILTYKLLLGDLLDFSEFFASFMICCHTFQTSYYGVICSEWLTTPMTMMATAYKDWAFQFIFHVLW